MAQYRVEFCKDWLQGRWGFTDRVFNLMGGRETEPTRLENAWLVNFKGSPAALGALLTRELNIQKVDFTRFGAIFEIQPLATPAKPAKPARPAGLPRSIPS